jgi:hypothetical protein
LIKKYVTDGTVGIVNLKIVNVHNGRYTITSSLWVGPDSVKLNTYIVDMMGEKKVKLLKLSKQVFLFNLERASHPMNSIFLAGHSQTISIRRGVVEEVFQTEDGRELMDLLENGQ